MKTSSEARIVDEIVLGGEHLNMLEIVLFFLPFPPMFKWHILGFVWFLPMARLSEPFSVHRISSNFTNGKYENITPII